MEKMNNVTTLHITNLVTFALSFSEKPEGAAALAVVFRLPGIVAVTSTAGMNVAHIIVLSDGRTGSSESALGVYGISGVSLFHGAEMRAQTTLPPSRYSLQYYQASVRITFS